MRPRWVRPGIGGDEVTAWLKTIGTSSSPLRDDWGTHAPPLLRSASFATRPGPNAFKDGDDFVYYALRGDLSRVVAVGKVRGDLRYDKTREVDPGWPWLVDIEITTKKDLISDGFPIDLLDSARELRVSVRRRSHIQLRPEELENARRLFGIGGARSKPHAGSFEGRLLRDFRLVTERPRGVTGTVYRVRSGTGAEVVYPIYTDDELVSEICVGQNVARVNFMKVPKLPRGVPGPGRPRGDWLGGGVRVREFGGHEWVTDENIDQWRAILAGRALPDRRSTKGTTHSPSVRKTPELIDTKVLPPQVGYELFVREKRTKAEAIEGDLVAKFVAYLEGESRDWLTRKMPTNAGRIQCDVYDRTNCILFEAKARGSDRSQIRMAIGQLFDYRYFGWKGAERKAMRLALLVPTKPPDDVMRLLASLGIGAAWLEKGQFVESHTAARP